MKFFIFIFTVSISISSEIDSLLFTLSQQENDTNKVKTIYDIAFKYSSRKLDSAFYYLDQGLKLSQKLNFDRGILKSLDHRSTFNRIKGDFPKALEYGYQAISKAELT